tara:strand:- start:124974 stop:126008 length:1035 start_codon:yes stop_codon:yes gene_type:complete
MHQRGYSQTIFVLIMATLMLVGCTSNPNWWDENGARRTSSGGYVPGTPLPAPDRRSGGIPIPPVRGSDGEYVVRSGDTLFQISRNNNVPIRSLIDANRLQPPYTLRTGQRLSIPTARYHVVRSGDTVYSISRAYGVDMATLTSTNRIPQPYTIKVGQKLQLPSQINDQVVAVVSENQSNPAGVPVGRPGGGYANDSVGTVPISKPNPGYKSPLPPPPVAAGDFVWPVQGKVISNYGAKEGGMHNDGINIAVPAGTPVRAAQSGVVAYAGNELKGYGNLLLVRHSNGWMTAYAHNSKLMVKRGDTVTRGQTISLAGSTGSVSSPQVHFELRKGAKAVDPRGVIGG